LQFRSDDSAGYKGSAKSCSLDSGFAGMTAGFGVNLPAFKDIG